MPVARWVAPFTTSVALGATAVSLYLTIVHYTDPDLLVCSDSGTVNCSAVTSSDQAYLLGIPVALLGLLWCVGMVALCLPVAWRSPARFVHQARIVGAVAGIGFVLWLIYAELIIVGAICLWCTVVHVLAFVLFAIVVMTASDVLAET
ncbi:MAG: vitamin K epoxide reductase family protein [Acidimicrobiia bacterium]|nr:vitamin K epoxide reductase family protein [Acidimicrobiia bacterium]